MVLYVIFYFSSTLFIFPCLFFERVLILCIHIFFLFFLDADTESSDVKPDIDAGGKTDVHDRKPTYTKRQIALIDKLLVRSGEKCWNEITYARLQKLTDYNRYMTCDCHKEKKRCNNCLYMSTVDLIETKKVCIYHKQRLIWPNYVDLLEGVYFEGDAF